MNSGQHRDSGTGAPGSDRGQRTSLEPGAFVGQRNGPAANMRVRGSKRGADIDTTTGSAGPRAYGEREGGVDD